MALLRMPARRRAITCVLRRSVCVKATRIAPSSSRVAKSMFRMRRVINRAASKLARSSAELNEKRQAAIAGFHNDFIQVVPETIAGQQRALWIKHAFGVERLKHSLQPRLESAYPHERYHARSKAPWIGGNLIKVGKRFGEFRRRFANHRHWNVTEFRLLSEHGQERLNHAQ